MTNQAPDPAFSTDDVDFEAFYQNKRPVRGTGTSFDVMPWDIGGPQPVLVDLEETGSLDGDVLDIGCGLGDNSRFLAERGYRVVGVDGSPTALEQARQRTTGTGLDIEFVQGDATRLDGFEQRFDTVVDSALYHCLNDKDRTKYAAALHRATRPGAQLHLFCFSDRDSRAFPLPMAVTKDDLHSHLDEHWDIRSIEPEWYTTALTKDFFDARSEKNFQAVGVSADPSAARLDEQGRVLAPIWHLHAVRK